MEDEGRVVGAAFFCTMYEACVLRVSSGVLPAQATLCSSSPKRRLRQRVSACSHPATRSPRHLRLRDFSFRFLATLMDQLCVHACLFLLYVGLARALG